jgi:ACS family sodium-dependent inorganic phosphate cotransporter
MAWMPTYYREVLKVSEDASGLHMIIPEFCGLMSSVAITVLGLGSKFSPLTTRRLFSSIAFLGSFVGLLLVATVRIPLLVTFCLCFVQGLATLQGSGFGQSYSEVSRHYVGLVTGVGNTVATIASFFAPVFASSIIPKESPAGPEAWQNLFLSFASANLVGLVIYSSFCSVTPVDLEQDDNNGTRPHVE